MKNFGLLCMVALLTALLVVPVSAQTSNPIYFGARAGLNLGNATLTPDLPSGISKSMRTGLSAGIYTEFGVAPGFGISVEALYQQGGFKMESGGEEATAKLDEIAIPISAKYRFFMENSTMAPFVFAGADLGFVSKAEVEAGGATLDMKESTESINFGIHFGAGIEFEASPGVKLFLDGRYNLGLKDVDKTTDEMKLQNIGILAGAAVAM